jgi:hypothetical protein
MERKEQNSKQQGGVRGEQQNASPAKETNNEQ